MLTKEDVDRIIENAFRELTLEVKEHSNQRTIVLLHKDREICRAWFDVKDDPNDSYY